jgi:hypothetical protein
MQTDLIKSLIKSSFPNISIAESIQTKASDTKAKYSLWCNGTELGSTTSAYDTEANDLCLFYSNTGCFTTVTGQALLKKLRSDYLRLV